MNMPHIRIDGRQPTPAEVSDWKARKAVADHLDLPDGSLNDWRVTPKNVHILSHHELPSDHAFGPRQLWVMSVDGQVYVLRVMTHPLQNNFSVHHVERFTR